MTCNVWFKSKLFPILLISIALIGCSQNPGFIPISRANVLEDSQIAENQNNNNPNAPTDVNIPTYDPYVSMSDANFDPYSKLSVNLINANNPPNSNTNNNTGDTVISLTRECRTWSGRNYYYNLSNASDNPQMVARVYSVESTGNVGKLVKQINLPKDLPKNFEVKFDKALIPSTGQYKTDKVVIDFCVSTSSVRNEGDAFFGGNPYAVTEGCINPVDGGNIINNVRDYSYLTSVVGSGSIKRAIPYYLQSAHANGTYDASQCDSFLASPLVLDLDNDGIKLSGQDANPNLFDIFGNGKKIKSGWVASAHDPFLALDLNHNGVIDDGGELFGSATKLSNRTTAANGFEALKVYDLNKDNQINSSDSIYSSLLLWDDQNHNKISEPDELKNLAESQVKAIGLKYEEVREADIHGNETRQRGNFMGSKGVSLIVDIWFAISK